MARSIPSPRTGPRGYLFAVAVVCAATLGGLAAAQHASLADEAMLYSLAILVAAHAGRGPGLLAAALSVIAFDFVFVEPRFTLEVNDTRFLFTFLVMFAVGAAIGTLTVRLRAAEAASRQRERDTAMLLAFTRDAAAASDVEGVKAAVFRHLRDGLDLEPHSVDVPAAGPIEINLGRLTIGAEQRALVEAVTRQATIAIEKLRLAATAREAELRATTEELRNALLSAVSHDLRTPLAVITGMASTLRETAEVAAHEGLDTIVAESERLSRILQNLLTVTKVEAGAKPKREWVPIEEVVGTALMRLDDALAGRKVAIAIADEALVHIDPILGELLLVNLLDNAAKHTPAGTPIELSARREGASAVIEVADRGPGIPAGSEKQVFERFFRAAGGTAAGVGLGLAVCRGITVAHGGTIEALPREGGGTVFRVALPDGEQMPTFDEPPAMAAEAVR
jgi:two-component system sensor histidine kinase KdpD